MEQTKAPKVKEITFTRTVTYTNTYSYENFMDPECHCYRSMEDFTPEQRRKVWDLLVEQADVFNLGAGRVKATMEVGEDDEEEDVAGDWTGEGIDQKVDEAADEVWEKEKKEKEEARQSLNEIVGDLVKQAGDDEDRIRMVYKALIQVKTELGLGI